MNVLVLGGSNMIGRHLVQELVAYGHQVTVLNRGQTPVEFPKGVQRLYADRDAAAAMRQALAGKSYDWSFDVSGMTRQQVQNAAESLKGSVGRYLFTSTTSAYERRSRIPCTEESPLLTPDSPPSPSKEYGLNKVACEHYLAELWAKERFPYTVLRPAAVYGPHNYMRGREFAMFARLRRGRKLLVPGNGMTVTHFVHVDDLVRAYHLAPQVAASLAQAYTLAGTEAATVTGLFQLLGEIVGASPQMVFVPWEKVTGTRPSWYPYEWERIAFYSIEKAKAHLGWVPNYNLRQGMEQTYGWYLESGMDNEPWDFSGEDKLLAELGT
ncbi:MAG: NAD-dependent epimerase/dehydratase family protein [Chloroflexi bacterium]|nr:NAD-dependent epimerase/dehydratase family protein [Chloroflexota bacterium]